MVIRISIFQSQCKNLFLFFRVITIPTISSSNGFGAWFSPSTTKCAQDFYNLWRVLHACQWTVLKNCMAAMVHSLSLSKNGGHPIVIPELIHVSIVWTYLHMKVISSSGTDWSRPLIIPKALLALTKKYFSDAAGNGCCCCRLEFVFKKVILFREIDDSIPILQNLESEVWCEKKHYTWKIWNKHGEYFWFKEWAFLSLPDLMIFHSVEQQNVLWNLFKKSSNIAKMSQLSFFYYNKRSLRTWGERG